MRYTGIVLDEDSRQRLIQVLQDKLQPLLDQGWQMSNRPPAPLEQLPHHMTMWLGQAPLEFRHLLDTDRFLVAEKWGQSDKAAAVVVRTNVRCTNVIPHITMAISPIGKPFHSNEIKEWIDIEPIALTGKIKEVM